MPAGWSYGGARRVATAAAGGSQDTPFVSRPPLSSRCPPVTPPSPGGLFLLLLLLLRRPLAGTAPRGVPADTTAVVVASPSRVRLPPPPPSPLPCVHRDGDAARPPRSAVTAAMSSSGGSGPPRGAALPAAKALSTVARRRLGKELDEWLSAEPPVPGMSVSATERLDLYVFLFFFPPFLWFLFFLCVCAPLSIICGRVDGVSVRLFLFCLHRVVVLGGWGESGGGGVPVPAWRLTLRDPLRQRVGAVAGC